MAPRFRVASNYYRDFTQYNSCLQEKESLGHAPPAGAGCVGGVCTVRLSLGFGSLHARLAARLVLMRIYDSAFRIWRVCRRPNSPNTLRPQPRLPRLARQGGQKSFYK